MTVPPVMSWYMIGRAIKQSGAVQELQKAGFEKLSGRKK